MKLQGVTYEWKKRKDTKVQKGRQLGLIAQDVEKVVPEIVTTNTNGFKSVGYAYLAALLIEGMKEQQKQIDTLKNLLAKKLAARSSQRGLCKSH